MLTRRCFPCSESTGVFQSLDIKWYGWVTFPLPPVHYWYLPSIEVVLFDIAIFLDLNESCVNCNAQWVVSSWNWIGWVVYCFHIGCISWLNLHLHFFLYLQCQICQYQLLTFTTFKCKRHRTEICYVWVLKVQICHTLKRYQNRAQWQMQKEQNCCKCYFSWFGHFSPPMCANRRVF